ncbi:MAG: TIGR00341 family protein [Candidatus Acidiferrales bacterium]
MDNDRGSGDREKGKLFRRTKLRAAAEQLSTIYESVLESSQIDIEYVALLSLAGLIALFGLLENSAAVIIGAMLISPLMNPILSAALALLLGDGKLGKRSASVLAFSVAGIIGITWLVASLTPLKQATPEIFARTAPNLLDLFIAFLSGLAGTLALRGGSVALTILPGVAIAVAVVPPLSVVGYGLSTHQGSIAGGAFLLFFTNLVSIVISAAVVFRIIGFQPQQESEQGRWKLRYRIGISALVLILLSIPLFLTLRKAAIEVAMRSEVQGELKKAFQTDKASVSDLSFSKLSDGLSIQATLRTTRYVETGAIHSVEDTLRKRFGPDTKLLIDQILVTQGGVTPPEAAPARNPILGGVVKPVEEKARFDFKVSNSKSLEFVQSAVDSVLAGTAIHREAAPVIDFGPDGPTVLRLQLTSPDPLTAQTISLLASQLESKLGVPTQLHGQVEVNGPSFQFTLAPRDSRSGLTGKDRIEVIALIKRLQQETDLQLLATYSPDLSAPKSKETPRFVSEFRDLLVRSRFNSSRWSIQAAPNSEPSLKPPDETPNAPVKANEKTSAAPVPAQASLDVRIFQNF